MAEPTQADLEEAQQMFAMMEQVEEANADRHDDAMFQHMMKQGLSPTAAEQHVMSLKAGGLDMQDNGEETFSWAADGTFVGSSDEIVALSGGASNFVPGSSVHAPNVAASSFTPKPVGGFSSSAASFTPPSAAGANVSAKAFVPPSAPPSNSKPNVAAKAFVPPGAAAPATGLRHARPRRPCPGSATQD